MKTSNIPQLTLSFTICALMANTLTCPSSFANGKKSTDTPVTPKLTTPNPLRPAGLAPFGTTSFVMPNGKTADLSADLNTLFLTAVTESTNFAPSDATAGECDKRIVISGAMSAVDLDVAGTSISFGYTPSGSTNTVTNVTGTTSVKVSTISMDFAVKICSSTSCETIAASTATQASAGVDLNVSVDFSEVTTGAQLLFNSSLSTIFRNIMKKGLASLLSTKVADLPWTAKVFDFDATNGVVHFDKGFEARLQPNQSFAVQTFDSTAGECAVTKTVAYIYTTRVDGSTSVASVEQTLEAIQIKTGDIIRIRKAN